MVAIYSFSNQIGMISVRSRLIRKNEFHSAQTNNLNKLNARAGTTKFSSQLPFICLKTLSVVIGMQYNTLASLTINAC
jgi:hypothetical protein